MKLNKTLEIIFASYHEKNNTNDKAALHSWAPGFDWVPHENLLLGFFVSICCALYF